MNHPQLLTPDAWQKAHRNTITASRVPHILGIPFGHTSSGKPIHYSSPYAQWAELTGKVEPANLDDNEAVQWGHRLEGVILSHYEQTTGRLLAPSNPTAMYWREGWGCTPDGLILTPEAKIDSDVPPSATVNAKNVGWRSASHWFDGEDEVTPPMAYQVQLWFEMWVLGLDWGSLAALIGGQRFVYKDIEYVEQPWALERLAEFQRLIDTDTEPELDDSESTAETLKLMFPEHKPKTYVFLGDGLRTIADELAAAEAKIADLKVEKRGYENRIKRALGDNEYGRFEDGSGFSLKTQVRKAHAVKESRSRPLRRIKEEK